jgi:hypothetical protein
MHERGPVLGIESLEQHDLDASAARHTRPEQPRRKDLRVVDHEDVAGAQPRRQIGNMLMRDRAGSPIEHEQTRSAALGGWRLRDQGFRQLEIEIRNQH